MAPSRYELILLRLVDEGGGQWSWYNIETRLSNMSVPRDPDALRVLKDLAEGGSSSIMQPKAHHETPGS